MYEREFRVGLSGIGERVAGAGDDVPAGACRHLAGVAFCRQGERAARDDQQDVGALRVRLRLVAAAGPERPLQQLDALRDLKKRAEGKKGEKDG